MLLFLGAGASKPFGIPDMNDLTNKIMEELKPSGKIWIITQIQKKVESFDMKPDIEAILTCIDALSNPKKGIKDAGPFAALITSYSRTDELTLGQKKEYYHDLSTKIRETIKKYCFLPEEEKINNIVRIYEDLFRNLSFSQSQKLDVFTTNYDCCFERYCSEKGHPLFDGFKSTGIVQKFMGMENPEGNWNICKLHGSSNYFLTNKDELIKTDTVLKPGDRITSGVIAKESMVFPTREKYFSSDPYFSLIKKLRRDLTEGIRGREYALICIIGYSFRDPVINNAFIDASKTSIFKSKEIFLVDPYANRIIDENIPELKHLIKPITKKFEELKSDDFPK